MSEKDTDIIFHDLLNFATSIRNILYLIIMKKTQPDKETEEYLQDCLKRCNHLVEGLQDFRKDWETAKNSQT